MQIGICAPYNRSEVSVAAIRLAELAMELSLSAQLLSTQPVERGIHPFWDKYVCGHKGRNVYKWAANCDHFVWFDVNEKYVQMAKLVSPKAKHYVVPLWHRLRRQDTGKLDMFDLVVSPSMQLRTYLIEKLAEAGMDERLARQKVAFCKWESGLSPVSQTFFGDDHSPSLYAYLDGFAVDECGSSILRILGDLLEMFPEVSVTMDCAKSWSRRMRAEVKSMKDRWKLRFSVRHQTPLPDQLTFMHTHDWTFLPSPRVDIGVMAMRSLSCGVPVIAFDVPPLGELLSSPQNASLIPCELSFNWLGAPSAYSQASQVMKTCVDALDSKQGDEPKEDSDETGVTSSPDSWQLGKRQRAFSVFWAQLWGVESL